MSQVDLGDFLEALPPGKELWLSALGRSMAPILRSGDKLKVLRCEAGALLPGDIGVARRPDGALIAHMVTSTQPLTTASFLGKPDNDGGVLLGKAIAVGRGALQLPIPPGGRLLLWLLHLGAAAAYRNSHTRAAARGLRDALSSRFTLALRRRHLGELQVRGLRPDDFRATLLFVSDHLSLSAEFLRRQLPERWQRIGAAAGAFDRRGRMVGFAYLDEYHQERVDLDGFWFRYVFIAPVARNMGLAQSLVAELCAAARERGIERVLADVRADNGASRAAFQRLGFTVAATETVRVNDVLGSRGELVALERQLIACPAPGVRVPAKPE